MMLAFDEAAHAYHLDGLRVPSVTQITGTLESFEGVPVAVLERKRAIGSALHKAIELHLADDLVYASIAAPVLPYFDAFLAFMRDTRFLPDASELRVASKIYKYAGTLDLAGHFVKGKAPVSAIIDFKTTATLSPAVALQTAAYQQAASETTGKKYNGRAALHLKPDGTYALKNYTERSDFEIFKSLLNIHRWKENNHV